MNKQVAVKAVFATVLCGYLLYVCVTYNIRVFFVATGSMGLAVPEKSLVVSSNISVGDIRPGMVLVFNNTSAGRITVHRVVGAVPGLGFRTRGDVNTLDDRDIVELNSVLGIVCAVFPSLCKPEVLLDIFLLLAGWCVGVLTRRFLIFLN